MENKLRVKVTGQKTFKIIVITSHDTLVKDFKKDIIKRLSKNGMDIEILNLRINDFKMLDDFTMGSVYEEEELIDVEYIPSNSNPINVRFVTNLNEDIPRVVNLETNVIDAVKEVFPNFILQETGKILNKHVELSSDVAHKKIKDIIINYDKDNKEKKYTIFIQWNKDDKTNTEAMQLFIKRFTGPAHNILVFKDTTITTMEELTHMFDLSLEPGKIKFIYTGVRINHNGTIISNRIRKGTILHLAPED